MKDDREFTFRAVLIGLVLSLAMAAANMYLGLKVGLTISANIPCSVIALILFHTILRTRSIAEVNLAQATGSVGEGLAAGIIFVFPALVLSGFQPARVLKANKSAETRGSARLRNACISD